MEYLSSDIATHVKNFAEWAWARHHNPLSWYIRPLLLIPYVWFAYRRSWLGVVVSLIALLTSMFWFPAPLFIKPEVQIFLDAEKAYLLGDWDLEKFLWLLLVPVALFLLALVFWIRSFWLGLVLWNLIAFSKILWSFLYTPREGAWALTLIALSGVVVSNVFLYWLWLKFRQTKKFEHR